MEELFAHEDTKWGNKIVVLSKDDSVGISTSSGTLVSLDLAKVAELHAALGEHLAKHGA